MTTDEIKSDLTEMIGIAKIALSSFKVLEYLHLTVFGIEGTIITENAFLRTSIFAYWRITVLELTKLFPDTPNDRNNNFALRLFVHKLNTETNPKIFSEEEIHELQSQIQLAYDEETNSGNKVVKSILVQRDTSIAHTDRGRIILPYGVSLENLMFLIRRAFVIIELIYRKVYETDFADDRSVVEPATGLQQLVEEVAGNRRRAINVR